GDFDILLSEAYEGPPTSILDARVRIFCEYFDDFLFVFLPLILNDFYGRVSGHIKRIHSLGQRKKRVVVPNVWPEAPHGNRHLLAFELPYFLRQLEQIEGLLKRDGLNHLPWP